MNGLFQDLRYALRRLGKSPGFTAVAVLTLALGIGASTAMFGVMNAVLLRPLPFRNPERLVRVLSTQDGSVNGPSPLDVRDFAAQNRSFEKLVVYDHWRKNVSPLAGSGEPEQKVVGLVPAGYFEVLDIKPLMGRLFTDEENQWGKRFEAILSYEFWQTRFRGDPAIIGKTIRINDEPYTIIAVMPDEIPDWWFDTPRVQTELWTPFVPYASASDTVWDESARGAHDFSAIGRLKAGVSLDQAQADLQKIAGNLSAQYPLDHGVGVILRPLQEDRAGNLRPVVLLLMGAVILTLLIACSNVVNLLLAKNSSRTREVALRIAMGAARSALIRQFLVESLVLGLLGGVLGCALAWWACAVVANVHPMQLPQLVTVQVDFRVLLFALAVAVGSSLFFGAIPAWVGSGVNLSETFKEGGRANVAARSRQWLRRAFVASEMAFAIMLLVGTGLLIQSLLRLQKQEPGFRVDHLLRTHLYLPSARYPNPAKITQFCDEYIDRVRHLPGVQDAVISAAYPPDDQWMQNFTIENRPVSRLEDVPSATFNVTDSHYLHTLGIPLLSGRDFSDSDADSSLPVGLINQAFADRYFRNEDPVGKQIRLGLPRTLLQRMGASNGPNIRFTIIGVMGNIMNRGLALPPEPQLTTLFRQTPDMNYGFKNLMVRTALDPLRLAGPIRQQLHSLDPNLPFAEVSSMNEIMAKQTADRRYTTGLLTLFAVMGAVLGLVGAWILRRTISGLVFGISPADPMTFLAAASGLIALAAVASYIPARRAAKVDPMVALRYE